MTVHLVGVDSAGLAPPIGVERVPNTYEVADGLTRARFGDVADVEIAHSTPGGSFVPPAPYPCHNGGELRHTGQTKTDGKDLLTCANADRRWSARSLGSTSQPENAGSIPVARSFEVAGQRPRKLEVDWS